MNRAFSGSQMGTYALSNFAKVGLTLSAIPYAESSGKHAQLSA